MPKASSTPLPQRLRRFAINVGFALVAFYAAHSWQTRSLLTAGPAPAFAARDLNGIMHVAVADEPAQTTPASSPHKTLLYFFAPWCGVCKLSIGNLNHLRNSLGKTDAVAIYAVALSYDSEQSVRDFAAAHDLKVPVLLGDDKILDAYKVGAFPTYYVIDANGGIEHADVGYSTTLGMRLRLL